MKLFRKAFKCLITLALIASLSNSALEAAQEPARKKIKTEKSTEQETEQELIQQPVTVPQASSSSSSGHFSPLNMSHHAGRLSSSSSLNCPSSSSTSSSSSSSSSLSLNSCSSNSNMSELKDLLIGTDDIFRVNILPFIIDVFDIQNQRDLRCVCKAMKQSIPHNLIYNLIKTGLQNRSLKINKRSRKSIAPFFSKESSIQPLHQAAMMSGDNVALVQFLIHYGAEVDSYGEEVKRSATPMDLAREAKNVQVCTSLEPYYPEESGSLWPLHIEQLEEHIFSSRILLGGVINKIRRMRCINFRDKYGQTPFHKAVAFGTDMVIALLAAGANVNTQDNSGNTPLHFIMRLGGSEAKINLIFEIPDYNINIQNNNGDTPLHIGLGLPLDRQSNNSLELLINHPGINLNIPNNAGKTPLIVALECGASDHIINLLRERGATE